MENLFKISNSNELNKIFEHSGDKLVILYFFTKNNPDCRKTIGAFEKSAMNHSISYFCILDMDKFEGDSRYTNSVNHMPKIDLYYMGNGIGTCQISSEKDIEQAVRSGEQYIMTQNNMKNNNTMGNNVGMNTMMNISPMQIQQIQQQILNNAQMSNPMQFQYLMQNPPVLQQLVQKQVMALQQQQMMQSMIQPQMPNMMTNMMNMIPSTTPNVIPNTNMPNMMNLPSTDSSNNILPTFQQMQQMFQIFQMMQQMGILNTQSTPIETPVSKPSESEEIVLPNGDKLIPLPNGKYGLVKKN